MFTAWINEIHATAFHTWILGTKYRNLNQVNKSTYTHHYSRLHKYDIWNSIDFYSAHTWNPSSTSSRKVDYLFNLTILVIAQWV